MFSLLKGPEKVSAPLHIPRFTGSCMAITTHPATEIINSKVPGFLDRIGYIKNANDVILVLRENNSSVVEYLKKNSAKVFQWEVELSKMEETNLQEREH